MKVYLVTQESNCDGEILFNVVPCKDLETAKKVMQEEVETLLSECCKYQYYEEMQDCYILEQSDESFYIETIYDDYYEDIRIEEKEIVE